MCGAEVKSLPEGVQRVAVLLQASGHAHAPVMLDDAARTAQQAADALGVSVGQIAKSIVFRRKLDDAAVLVVTSGDQRVDEKKVEALVCGGKRLGRADAAFVKERTGFTIGGVAPLAHATPVVILIDQSVSRFEDLWAPAGHPHAVVQALAASASALDGCARGGLGGGCGRGKTGACARHHPGHAARENGSQCRRCAVALHFNLPHERQDGPVRRLLSHAGRNCRLERRG